VHIFTAQELDLANNTSPFSAPLTITIETSAPAPTALTLSPASDSGVKGDNITNVVMPVITGSGEAGDTLLLFDGTTLVGTTVVAADGGWSVTSTALTSGIHTFTAQELDLANNASPFSAPLTIAIKTSAAAPAALSLSAMSDSGVKGDNVTNVVMPVITGSGEAGDTLLLFDGTTLVGMTVVAADGGWSVASNMLASGVHIFTAQEIDLANNTSPFSTGLSLTIKIFAPPPANLALVGGGTRTTNTTPTFTGTGEAGDLLTLYDGTMAIGTATVAADGTWSVTTSSLANGLHTITARETDLADNTSAPSAAFPLTIGLAGRTDIVVFDVVTQQFIVPDVEPYTGPVQGILQQFIYTDHDSVNVAVSSDNWFIATIDDGGNNGVIVHGGTNVVDGGHGSIFVTGGTGTDTFFLDDRTTQKDIWTTILNFHKDDAVTIFGVSQGAFDIGWFDDQGWPGFTGLTLHGSAPGHANVSVTLPGFTTADLSNGKLSTSFGTETDGTPYFYIHDNA
jgi:hypothetical protein